MSSNGGGVVAGGGGVQSDGGRTGGGSVGGGSVGGGLQGNGGGESLGGGDVGGGGVGVGGGSVVVDGGPVIPGCTVPENTTVPATLRVTADDMRTVYLNGQLIDATMNLWYTPSVLQVTLNANSSVANVIAVEGDNLYNTSGFDRGVLLDVTASGVPLVQTDSSWLMSIDAGVDWQMSTFDDTDWVAPYDEGPHSIGPWGSIFGSASDAHWLWSYDSSVVVKPVNESVFFRKTFYLLEDGGVSSKPVLCQQR